MSEKDQVVEILRKAISPPFKATLGDGAGNVVVTGRPGYIWCRKLGRSEMLMQAYNRGAQNIESIIVLVQESRIEHLGYEVVGYASGASPDDVYPPVPPHAWTHEWRPGIGRDRVTVYPRSWGYLRAEPIETGSMNVWVTPGWLYYSGEYIWYPGDYSPVFGFSAGPSWYQTLYMDPSDQSLHIMDGVTGPYGYAEIPVPSGCMLPIAAVESTGTFSAVTENMIEDIRLFMDPIEDCDGLLPFGSCYGNHIAWVQANAVQNTWYNISDADIADGPLEGVTHDGSGKLTVTEPGEYLIVYSLCYEDDIAKDHLEVGIEVNGSGAAEEAGRTHSENKFANEMEHLGGGTILNLPDNATVELVIRTVDAGTPTITVIGMNLSLHRLGEGEGGGARAHNLLDGSVHPDTVAQAVTRGSLIVGEATLRWDELPIGAAARYLRSDGTDPAWAQISASEVVNTPAGGIVATDVQAAINELDSEKAGIADAETITADWTWGTDKKIFWRDAAIYIHSAADGFLDLVADTAIRLGAQVLVSNASDPAFKISSTNVAGSVLHLYADKPGQTQYFAFVSLPADHIRPSRLEIFDDTAGMRCLSIVGGHIYFQNAIAADPTTGIYFPSTVGVVEAEANLGRYQDTKLVLRSRTISLNLETNAQNIILSRNLGTTADFYVQAADGGIFMLSLKRGANQGAAGAAANELWLDSADESVKRGV